MKVHRLIYRAAANPRLEDVLIRYDKLVTRIWCLVVEKVPAVAEHIAEHAELFETIAGGDADRTGDLALEHGTSFEQVVRRVLRSCTLTIPGCGTGSPSCEHKCARRTFSSKGATGHPVRTRSMRIQLPAEASRYYGGT
ncbi:FCD domain-containing protein [Arthrobacter sp. MSA 4-2]|uniref:FCD domain-containing protein n=1 Tax=Arthrobacter sp. MSA 4-2 TaxID=2794349 RepID=UPI0027DAF6F9|nr:FCD domain-containing protein [Arthrobacter sp. MSA 4-2]